MEPVGTGLTTLGAGEYILAWGLDADVRAEDAAIKMSVTSWISGPEVTEDAASDLFDGAGCKKYR